MVMSYDVGGHIMSGRVDGYATPHHVKSGQKVHITGNTTQGTRKEVQPEKHTWYLVYSTAGVALNFPRLPQS